MNTIAMILAAGKGERLKPLTNNIPKPLIKVNGKSLLERNIEILCQSGISKIVINGSKMGDQIKTYIEDIENSNLDINYIYEGEDPLGTSGAIFNAIDSGLITEEYFWVINADILTNFSFEKLEVPSEIMGHIILVPNPEHNPDGDFGLSGDKVIIPDNQRYTFSGISFLSLDCFNKSSKRYFSLADLLNEFIEKELITGELFFGKWLDVGTIERLNIAEDMCKKANYEE